MAQPGPQAPVCVPQGELTITTDMEDLSTALFYDTVPDTWVARAYPSMMGLAAWYADLLLRIRVRTVRGAARPRPQRGPPPPEPAGTWPPVPAEAGRRPLAWPLSEQGRKGPIPVTKTPDDAGGSSYWKKTAASSPRAGGPHGAQDAPAGRSLSRAPTISSNARPPLLGPSPPVPSLKMEPARQPGLSVCGGHAGPRRDPARVPFQELEAWTTDFALPTTVWLAGFFNPQSFLTAIMQSMARKNEWPLDKMCLSVEVTKKTREDMTAPPREGSYVYGLFMEGQRVLGRRSFRSCPTPPGERLALGGNRPCVP